MKENVVFVGGGVVAWYTRPSSSEAIRRLIGQDYLAVHGIDEKRIRPILDDGGVRIDFPKGLWATGGGNTMLVRPRGDKYVMEYRHTNRHDETDHTVLKKRFGVAAGDLHRAFVEMTGLRE